ncbi:hypothetical protein [Candidatus Amarolinea dominans]|uniref:hypothetical protein n=1 Tax=Candidatus Amarolinea dominans TaxID=3140696 RepID=UPI001D9E84B5|nr:hypothetical protein [Anaerolineae bacterium]
MWFERLTGFPEVSPHQVREKIAVDGKMLISHVNGRAMVHGQLETPTLGELRERVHASGYQSGKMSVREIVANVQQLHTEVANAGALFQVASQFNLLEMVSPDVTPERGVGIYDHDHTQGPACAIAAGAGTIYRNYFAMVNGQIGQSASNQIDCLADVGAALGNTAGRLWEMRNGYALASQRGLAEITHRLQASSERELDELRQLLRIGLQWNTQVTLDKAKHTVSQAYCSALPVTYSTHPAPLWAAFARLILEAAYEATICAGILNALSSGNKSVFLTLLGGGAFGNTTEWIMSAIQRALNLNRYADLDVAIVSYGASNPQVQQLLHQWS